MGMETANSIVTVSYRGKNYEILFDEGTTLRQLGARVVDVTGVSPKTVKLLPPGKTSAVKGVAIKPFEDDDNLAVERGDPSLPSLCWEGVHSSSTGQHVGCF
jgi:hypothetical protein